jgi:hypothetical protein
LLHGTPKGIYFPSSRRIFPVGFAKTRDKRTAHAFICAINEPAPSSSIAAWGVQAAWVVLVRVKCWERYGLKSWIEAAKKRLHHNVLAIALANKLARIAWAVLNKGRAFECVNTEETASRPA